MFDKIKKLPSEILAIYKKGLLAGIAVAILLKILLVLLEVGGLLKFLPTISAYWWLNTFVYINIFIFICGLAMLGMSELMKSIALKSEGPEAFLWEDCGRTRGAIVTVEGTTQRKSDGRIYWKYIRQHIFSPTANAGVIEVGDPRLEFTGPGRTVKSCFVSHLIRLTDFPKTFG